MAPSDTTMVGTWEPLAPEIGLWKIDSQHASGLPARTLSLRLKDKSLLVIGPTAQLTVRHYTELRKMGRVSYILVPTSRWFGGVKEFGAKCPGVKYVAAKEAHASLQKHTGLTFETPWQSLRTQVPKVVQILVPDGLKNGEIWIRLQTRRGMAWVVGDILVNYTTIPTGLGAWRYWIRGLGSGLRIPVLQRLFAVSDQGHLRSWIFERIREDRPNVLIPLNGTPIASPDLPRRLRSFVDEYLGRET